MTRRRKLTFVALVTGAAVVTGLLTNSHWKVYGWVRGEPFWRGLPASYYAARARRAHPPSYSASSAERWARRNLHRNVADALWGEPPPFSNKPWLGSAPLKGQEP